MKQSLQRRTQNFSTPHTMRAFLEVRVPEGFARGETARRVVGHEVVEQLHAIVRKPREHLSNVVVPARIFRGRGAQF